MQVPVRNFIKFSLACCRAYHSCSKTLTDEQQCELIGNTLVDLGLFPDTRWRTDNSEIRISRRLELNLSYAELTTTSNADIEPEDIEKICSTLSLRDLDGNEYSPSEQDEWKLLCTEYSRHRESETRAKIPFHIFEQLFAKDVKGLKLGDRIQQEIESRSPDRLEEFDKLNIQEGLNSKIQEYALALLDAPQPEAEISLPELLSKQTRRIVEKVAYPTPEKFINPLIKLAEVTQGFHESCDDKAHCRVEVRLVEVVIPTLQQWDY